MATTTSTSYRIRVSDKHTITAKLVERMNGTFYRTALLDNYFSRIAEILIPVRNVLDAQEAAETAQKIWDV